MILETGLAIALRCPECEEQMLYRFVSLFDIKKSKQMEIDCSCGCKSAVITLGSKSDCYVSLMGSCCELPHDFSFTLDELQEKSIFSLTCDLDDTHLAYFGLKDIVFDALIAESLDLIERQDALKKFFREPQIVGGILTIINSLAKLGQVYCKECGSHNLNIKINSGDIQLQCGSCLLGGVFDTKNTKDLFLMDVVKKLLITQEGLELILPDGTALLPKSVMPANVKRFK